MRVSDSKATIAQLGTFAVVRSYAGILRDYRPSPDCIDMANQVMAAADRAMEVWGEATSKKGAAKVLAHLKRYMNEVNMLPNSYAMTSVALRVLEDLLEKRKPSNGDLIVTGKRRAAVEKLIDALVDLHHYFDRGNVLWKCFRVADIAAQSWLRIVDNVCACQLYQEQDRSRIMRDITEIKSEPAKLDAWRRR